MKHYRQFATRSVVWKPLAGVAAVLTTLTAAWGGAAHADADQDPVAKITELSHQVEQLAADMETAKLDLDRKMQVLAEVDRKHTEDLARFDAAQAELAGYQVTVNKLASAVYMGGRADDVNTILTATSPTDLIDGLAVQRAMATEMSGQMQGFRRFAEEARATEVASAQSAADARAAVDAAVALRSDLQAKQTTLQAQVTEVRAEVAMLSPDQRGALGALPASVVAALGPIAPVPTVGMGGLVPNARMLAQYVMATYPGVQSIGGVRSDPLPDHPSGRAIDIMITDMGLGDAINADIQSQAGRFGVAYTMWRVPDHFNHVHVTVS